MERGVYVAEFGNLMELAAIDDSGQPVRRVTVRRELYSERDLVEIEAWLNRVCPKSDALRLM